MCICSECSEAYIQYLIKEILILLQQHQKLVDSYILDFFVENHWGQLRESWRQNLLDLTPESLGYWLGFPTSNKVSHRRVWPLSLLALRSCAHYLSLSRSPEHCLGGGSDYHQVAGTHCKHCKLFSEDFFDDGLSTIFSRNIKPKKFHEIIRTAKVTNSCAEQTGCSYIVDVGAGLGHLGRILALRHGLKVCCLEEQKSLSNKAGQLDQQLLTFLSKKAGHTFLQPPIHINISIDSSLTVDDFLKLIYSAFGSTEVHFGIVGLHPCGDLGPTLLRFLANCPTAKFVNLVGCCYMKLTTKGDCQEKGKVKFGYPLSQHVSNIPDHQLSYQAREVACHALEIYSKRLKDGKVEELKVHCFRAALEVLLVKKWPALKHAGLRSIKHVNNISFEEYARLAVEPLAVELSALDFNGDEIHHHLNEWFAVVIYYSLRLLLAPCIESAMLLDRVLFLKDKGIRSILLPAFNPELSPRNFILIATKEKV